MQVLLSKRLTVVTVSRNESHSTVYTQGHRWAWLGTLFIVDLLLVRMVSPGLLLAVTVGRCYLVSKIMGLAGFKQLPGEESRPWSLVKSQDMDRETETKH